MYDAPEPESAEYANTEEARINMAFDGMDMELQALSDLLADMGPLNDDNTIDVSNI